MHDPIYLAHAGVMAHQFSWIADEDIPPYAYVYLYRNLVLISRCVCRNRCDESWYGTIFSREGLLMEPSSQLSTSILDCNHFKWVRQICDRADAILARETA